MNKLKKFFSGIYGTDELNVFFMAIFFVLTIIMIFTDNHWFFAILRWVMLVIALYRILSKNIGRRRQENQKFLNAYYRLFKKLNKKKTIAKGMKTYKHFDCPKCAQTVRVPRGRGKVAITCPKCQEKFIRET